MNTHQSLNDVCALQLDSKLTFGKHAGSTIQRLITEDPTYLKWCQENVTGFVLAPELQDIVDEELLYLEMADQEHYQGY